MKFRQNSRKDVFLLTGSGNSLTYIQVNIKYFDVILDSPSDLPVSRTRQS